MPRKTLKVATSLETLAFSFTTRFGVVYVSQWDDGKAQAFMSTRYNGETQFVVVADLVRVGSGKFAVEQLGGRKVFDSMLQLADYVAVVKPKIKSGKVLTKTAAASNLPTVDMDTMHDNRVNAREALMARRRAKEAAKAVEDATRGANVTAMQNFLAAD